MKKHILIILGIALLIGSQASGRADDEPAPAPAPASGVVVVGKLDPKLSVELSEAEMKQMLSSLKNLPKLEPKEIDINSLYAKGDENAIKRVKQLFVSLFLDSVGDLVDMKAVLYKLTAILTLPEGKRHKTDLYDVYTKKMQIAYDKMINRFTNAEVYKDLITSCESDLCALNVTDTIAEILRFAEQFNSGFEVDDLDDIDVDWKFESKLLQASFSEAMSEMIAKNQPTSLVSPVVGAAFGALAYSAEESINFGEFLKDLLLGGSLVIHEIEVKKTKTDFDTLSNQVAVFLQKKLASIHLHVAFDAAPQKKGPGDYHHLVLSCEKKGWDPGAHILIGGYYQYSCTVTYEDGGTKYYSAKQVTVGPGIHVQSSEQGVRFFLVMFSPVAQDPTGTWTGVTLKLAIGGGGELAAYVGPYAATMVVAGAASLGGGIMAGLGFLHIN